MSSPRNRRRRQTSPATKSKAPKINPSVTWVAGPIHFSSKAYFKKKPAASNKTKTPIPRNHFWPTATSVAARGFGVGGTWRGALAGAGGGGKGGGICPEASVGGAAVSSTLRTSGAVSGRTNTRKAATS